MKTNKGLLIVIAAIFACGLLICSSKSIRATEKTYELRPEITLPEYRTDTMRVVDAYERMMDRYMNLIESNLLGIAADVRSAAGKLDSVDRKLTKISARLTKIEKALGIEQHDKPHKKPPKDESYSPANEPGSQDFKSCVR